MAKTVAEAMKFTRNLANEPAAFATPTKLAEIAQGFEGLETVVYDEAKLEKWVWELILLLLKVVHNLQNLSI